MKRILMVGAAGLVAISALTNAADTKTDTKKPVSQWTCEDFLALDESFQPTAVGVAEAVDKSGKVEDAVLDVEGIATVTPMVVAACKEDQKASFRQKIKDEWDKAKKHM